MVVATGKKPSKLEKTIHTLKIVFGELWKQTPGKAGLILLVFLIAVSIYAVATISTDFLVRWQSPDYWEDNPLVAPPCWVNSLGFKTSLPMVVYYDKPTSISVEGGDLILNYTTTYTLDADDSTQGLYVKVYAPLICLEGRNVTPVITVIIERPDRIVFKGWEFTPPLGNVTCGDILPTAKTEAGNFLLSDFVGRLMKEYNITVPRDEVGGKEEYVKQVEAVIRSAMEAELRNRYLIVSSVFVKPREQEKYRIDLDREALKNKKPDFDAMINRISVIINNLTVLNISKFGITEEGRERILNYLRQAQGNILRLEDPEVITLSEYFESIDGAITSLQEPRKLIEDIWIKAEAGSIEEKMAEDMSFTIVDISNSLDKLRGLIKSEAFFEPLKGRYTITVVVRYHGVGERIETANVKAGIIVKGNCYGYIGTAAKGVDIGIVLLYGAPIALAMGVVVAVSQVFIGVIAGIISGYYGGWIDEVIQRIVDILTNIPFLPLMIIIGSVAQTVFTGEQKGLYIILLYMAILVVFGWAGLARTVRAMALSIKEEPYIEAARALGASNTRIIFKHIFPQVMMYATAVLVFSVPDAILVEAALSVLGLRHGWPTWGSLLADARQEFNYGIWWWILPPGIMISLTSLTFVLLGLAIERIVEPRLRTM